MLPIARKDHNLIYHGPTDEIGDLPCRRVEPGMIAGHWRPSAEELAILNDGGSVEVTLWSEPIPPLAVNVVTKADDAKMVRATCPRCQHEHALEAPGQKLICDFCRKAFKPEGEAA